MKTAKKVAPEIKAQERKCILCGASDHRKGATFCYNCGKRLNLKVQQAQ